VTNLITIDTWKNDDCTVGRLAAGDFQCFTLELPWQNNWRDISCIPEGAYIATKYDSPKHGNVLLLHNVQNRSLIEIHAGNFTRQIEGCILVGDSIKFLDGDEIPDVTNSKRTLSKLLSLVDDEVTVVITRR
jgi:hypothetical protein